MPHLTRRTVLASLAALPGCASLSALNDAATPRDTYALQPVDLGGGTGRGRQTLLVVAPSAAAALATDRILIRPDALSITYLPAARWADELPNMLSAILVRSISSTGRFGFVGAQGDGPIPDLVLLTRIDRFDVTVDPSGTFTTRVTLQSTLLRDSDQRIIASRQFTGTETLNDDSTRAITRSFQTVLDRLLPDLGTWVTRNA